MRVKSLLRNIELAYVDKEKACVSFTIKNIEDISNGIYIGAHIENSTGDIINYFLYKDDILHYIRPLVIPLVPISKSVAQPLSSLNIPFPLNEEISILSSALREIFINEQVKNSEKQRLLIYLQYLSSLDINDELYVNFLFADDNSTYWTNYAIAKYFHRAKDPAKIMPIITIVKLNKEENG